MNSRTVPFAELRRLRDIAGQLGARDLESALEELIHLRSARVRPIDGIDNWAGADRRIEPEDLR